MKKYLKFLIYLPIDFFILIGSIYSNILSKVSKKLYWEDKLESSKKSYYKVSIENNKFLKFNITNTITKFRAETFFEKEPDTIKWINEYNGQGDLFDIGANIGVYCNYFAKLKTGHVHAFESSFYNLSLLAKNCQINNNEDKITIHPYPLFEKNKIGYFKMTDEIQGGAMSSFGVDYGFDGKEIQNYQKYLIPGFNIDFLIEEKIINKVPSLIKIDVDGVEDLILKGAEKTLNNNICNSVLIEVNEEFENQFENIQKIMTDNNFNLTSTGKKTEVQELKFSQEFGKTYNQIWIKD